MEIANDSQITSLLSKKNPFHVEFGCQKHSPYSSFHFLPIHPSKPIVNCPFRGPLICGDYLRLFWFPTLLYAYFSVSLYFPYYMFSWLILFKIKNSTVEASHLASQYRGIPFVPMFLGLFLWPYGQSIPAPHCTRFRSFTPAPSIWPHTLLLSPLKHNPFPWGWRLSPSPNCSTVASADFSICQWPDSAAFSLSPNYAWEFLAKDRIKSNAS